MTAEPAKYGIKAAARVEECSWARRAKPADEAANAVLMTKPTTGWPRRDTYLYRDVAPGQLRKMGPAWSQITVAALSIGLYCLVTVAMGVPLLLVAAALVGGVAYYEACRSGRLYAPIVAHLTWSIGMLLILPRFFT